MAGRTGKITLDETVRREGLIKPLKPEHKKMVRSIYAGIDKKRGSITTSKTTSKPATPASKRMGK